MTRKLFVLFVIVGLMMSIVASTSAETDPGCYVNAPASVNEGETINVMVTCDGVTDDVYGFEFGTSVSGNTITTPTTYTLGSQWTTNTLEGKNSLALVAYSHQGTDVSTGDFDLAGYNLLASKGLTANGAVQVNLNNLKLSDNLGNPLDWNQANPDATITVNNIPLALMGGSVTIKSDGSMTNLKNLTLTAAADSSDTAGSSSLTPVNVPTAAGSSKDINLSGLEYYSDLNANLKIDIDVTMDSHLACVVSAFDLVDGPNDAALQIGTITLKAGDVTSVSGDHAINLQDSVAIGAAFGTASSGSVDVNKDGTVDIYDLVHVGRNYNATQSACVGVPIST